MQLTASAEQKVISQYITVYQSIISFSLEKMGMEISIKYNKSDMDNMLDDCNAHLIEVCEDYLKEHKLSLDKFQLATIVAQLWSQTISELEEPFRVTVRESKHLIQEYLEKNKSKREALERIQKENDSLDAEIKSRESELKKQQKAARTLESDFVAKPEMPSENLEAGAQGFQPPMPKPKKSRPKTTDDLAMDNFKLPI